jgi:anion-transporting  ArsA/GET3 family ATPase
MKDILVLGKVKQLERAHAADLIVLDAPAAGHAVQFLLSARGLLDAVTVGPVRKQASDVVELLTDPSRCQVMLVTLPEETPVNELVDTAYAIEDRAGVRLGPIVVNGCVSAVDGLLASTNGTGAAAVRADAALAGIELGDGDVDALATAAAFRVTLRARQQEQRVRLAARLPLPQIELPFLFTADVGPSEIDVLADALTVGVEAMDAVQR